LLRRQSNYQYDKSKEAKNEKPEPDEDVNLFVDNVKRQNAESIMLLDVAGSAELVERALGHAREDVDHRINSILLGDNSLKLLRRNVVTLINAKQLFSLVCFFLFLDSVL